MNEEEMADDIDRFYGEGGHVWLPDQDSGAPGNAWIELPYELTLRLWDLLTAAASGSVNQAEAVQIKAEIEKLMNNEQ